MSHWAEIDENNIVIRVLVGDNNVQDEGESFMNLLGGDWIKTSYNGTIRKNFAGVGYTYDADRDAFIAPEPEGNIGFDTTTCQWIMPIVDPDDIS